MAHAICPYCSKNISVDESSLREYRCGSCGNTLTVAFLREKNAFIDLDASNIEFQTGRGHLDERDFPAAAECFKKALRFNPNNYMAEYYSGLCEISENAEKEDFSVPKTLCKMFVSSLIKADNSQLEPSQKIGFVTTLLSEIYVSLFGYFNDISERFENNDYQKLFRAKAIDFVAAVREIISLDASLLCLSEKSVAVSFKDIIDLAIDVCFHATHSFADGFDSVNTPSDEDFVKVRDNYEDFIAFQKALDKKYKCPHKINFDDNITCNKEVIALIEKYYDLNRGNKKARLSITGEFLDNMVRQCMTAVRLTYFTCVRNIGVVKSDNVRNDLINQAISIGLEIMMPRLYMDGRHRVSAIVKNMQQMRTVTEFLDLMADSLSDGAKKTAGDAFKDFYGDVHETVKMHYENVNREYEKIINKLKRAQNEEFVHYLGFLNDMATACASALVKITVFTRYKTKSRITCLKLCRRICEEFLLLTDYRIESIEKSRFKDIISIYGALDGDIAYLAKV